MTYDQYRYIFIGAAILCGIMLIASVIIFFVLKIPRVIGDLTGSTARKAIEEIRQQNEESGHKTYRSSAVNRERGKLTDKISPSGSLLKDDTTGLGGAMETEKIGTQQLMPEVGETEVLEFAAGETEVLSEETNVFKIEYEITFIHTEEMIS